MISPTELTKSHDPYIRPEWIQLYEAVADEMSRKMQFAYHNPYKGEDERFRTGLEALAHGVDCYVAEQVVDYRHGNELDANGFFKKEITGFKGEFVVWITREMSKHGWALGQLRYGDGDSAFLGGKVLIRFQVVPTSKV